MSLSTFAFTPAQGYRDSSYAPTDPSSETEFRDTMQGIPDQLKEYINTVLLPSLASTTATSSGAREIGSETIAPLTGNTVYAQLVSLLNYINQTALNFTMGAIPDDSIETKKLKNVDMAPVQLSFGTNTITKIGLETTPLNTTFTPLSYVNAQGKNGNCESVTPFTTVSGCTLSLDTSKKVFGAKALKITLTDVVGIVSIPVGTTFDVSSNYLFSAYLDKGTSSEITLQKDATGGGVVKSVTSVTTTPTRSGFLTIPTDNHASNLIKIVVNGTSGQVAYIDGIMNNAITTSDALNPVATVMTKYPYADSLAVTKNPYLKSSHTDGSSEECVVEGDFFTGDTLELKDGRVIGSKLWKYKTLFGKDYAWELLADGVGNKIFRIQTQGIIQDEISAICVKYDGKPLGNVNGIPNADEFRFYTAGIFDMRVSDTDTGFAESISPNNDEVKAFMNGWKSTANNGTRYTAWVSVADGTTTPTTQTIDFVKSNLAPNYEGYKLAYKLATAQPINEGSDSYLAPLKGDIPVLKQGVNTVTFDTGVVLGEVAMPTFSTSIYFINDKNITSSRLRNKVQRIIAVRKNGNIDLSFTIETYVDAYGLQRVYCTQANFDPSATYTVDYEILDELAPQIGTAEASYSEGLVDSVNALYGLMQTKQNQSEVLDDLVDKAMYEKIMLSGVQGRFMKLSESDHRLYGLVKLVRKNSDPIVTINLLSAYAFNGDGTTTNLPVGDIVMSVIVYEKERAVCRISYVGNDSTVKSKLLNYGGVWNSELIFDCRGVI